MNRNSTKTNKQLGSNYPSITSVSVPKVAQRFGWNRRRARHHEAERRWMKPFVLHNDTMDFYKWMTCEVVFLSILPTTRETKFLTHGLNQTKITSEPKIKTKIQFTFYKKNTHRKQNNESTLSKPSATPAKNGFDLLPDTCSFSYLANILPFAHELQSKIGH